MIIYLLFPFIEHFTTLEREALASWFDSRGWKAYYAHWLAPVLAIANSALLGGILVGWSWQNALIPASMAMVYYEVSNLWKQKKREAMPLHTKTIAKTIDLGGV